MPNVGLPQRGGLDVDVDESAQRLHATRPLRGKNALPPIVVSFKPANAFINAILIIECMYGFIAC